MHPALRPSNISRLSVRFKRDAEKIARGDASPQEIIKFFERASTTVLPASQKPLLAPLLYILLDSAEIPRIPGLLSADTESESANGALFRAFTALEAFGIVGLAAFPENGALEDTWERAWAWARFFATHADLVSQFLPVGGDSAPRNHSPLVWTLLSLFGTMQQRAATAALLRASDGLGNVVAAIWMRTLRIESSNKPFEDVGVLLSILIQPMDGYEGTSLPRFEAGLLEVTGGEPTLVSLCVEHLRRAVPKVETLVVDRICSHFVGVLLLLFQSSERPTIKALLLEARLIRVLCTIWRACLVSLAVVRNALDRQSVKNVCGMTFQFMLSLMDAGNGYRVLIDALESGFLQGVVAYGTNNDHDTHLGAFIAQSLSSATVFFSVLKRLKPALGEVKAFEVQVALTLRPIWADFVGLAEERIKLAEQYSEGKLGAATRGCDNPECNAIGNAGEYKWCSGCRSYFYCSRTCQRRDWKVGTHRLECLNVRNWRSSGHRDASLSTRDWQFIRVLMAEDYRRLQRDIWMQLMPFMDRQRDVLYPCVVFDYTKGRCTFQVEDALHRVPEPPLARTLENYHRLRRELPPQVIRRTPYPPATLETRIKASGHKIQPHFVKLGLSMSGSMEFLDHHWQFAVPLHTDKEGPGLLENLRELAQNPPAHLRNADQGPQKSGKRKISDAEWVAEDLHLEKLDFLYTMVGECVVSY
ncbi:MYND-type domain-containing protein [Mycena chlorophos]|uniref:MYND-type domain-containing protein n=1 Tax=Mycena chlorophos TaxID=658473 RepID=A0A8H6SDP1_MYCCL|nr:MYND-type domain-containing protein [Mycena chlorophos]